MYIGFINQSANRLMNTINDIVEISQIQTTQAQLTLSETNITELTDDLYAGFKPEALKKGLNLSIKNSLSKNTDSVFTDSQKLKTILSNLISNAIKFTKAGSIECCIRYTKDWLEFSVKDTGIGIPENKQQSIFERFMQADVSNTRPFDGIGLGLSISKAYVEMLGGKIWVESQVDKGSEFFFTIPCIIKQKATHDTETPAPSKDREEVFLKMKNIMIVEDDELSEMLLSEIVRDHFGKSFYAKTGFEAIEICRNNPDIDLILMDIKMSGMNGYEATRQIRLFNKDVIIIAQTAFCMVGDREKALAAGCNDYISKPYNRTSLMRVINKALKIVGA
jgi:CheY-like chemotaxis protein/two-component sensor histidine kinase